MTREHLTPFIEGDSRAVIAGKKSGEVRRARAVAERAKRSEDALTLASHLATFTQTFDRTDVGAQAAAVAQMILARIAANQIPIRHAADAAELLRVLVDVTRLEEGLHTTASLSAQLDSSAIVARIEQMRAELTPPPPT